MQQIMKNGQSPAHSAGRSIRGARRRFARFRSWHCTRPRLEWMEDRTLLATFIVSNTNDTGLGSLRQAIVDANDATTSPNTIAFDIKATGVQIIAPLSPLPMIESAVTIDGQSQKGYAGTPLIELNGTNAGTADGLTIIGNGVTVFGLDIVDFSLAQAFTSRGAARRTTGSMTTSWAPTRPALWPSPTRSASRSTAALL